MASVANSSSSAYNSSEISQGESTKDSKEVDETTTESQDEASEDNQEKDEATTEIQKGQHEYFDDVENIGSMYEEEGLLDELDTMHAPLPLVMDEAKWMPIVDWTENTIYIHSLYL